MKPRVTAAAPANVKSKLNPVIAIISSLKMTTVYRPACPKKRTEKRPQALLGARGRV